MTLPNRRRVTACERRAIGSSNSHAAGESKLAKSARASFDFPRLRRASSVDVWLHRFAKASCGRRFNSVTKLIVLPGA
jgi:hypothetical protein